MRRLWIAALIILSLQACTAVAKDYEIDVSLFKGDPSGSRESGTLKRVAAPKIFAKSGEDASLLVGGQVPVAGEYLPAGQQVHVLAKDEKDGAILVTLSLEDSTLSGAKAKQVTSTRAQVTATVQSGGTMRLELGHDPKNKHWVEITIRSAK